MPITRPIPRSTVSNSSMHAQGRDAIEFYTEKKIVVERWAKEHSRKF